MDHHHKGGWVKQTQKGDILWISYNDWNKLEVNKIKWDNRGLERRERHSDIKQIIRKQNQISKLRRYLFGFLLWKQLKKHSRKKKKPADIARLL